MRGRSYLLFFWLFPSIVSAQSVKIFSEKGINWSSYSSFSVADGELVTVLNNDIEKEKLLAEIRGTIISELSSRGLEFKPEGGDLRVDFTGQVVETTNVEEIGPLGQEPADEPAEMDQSRVWTQEMRQGSLIIDVREAKSNQSLWRSTATAEFGSEELAVVFNAATGRSLKKFPVRK